jgi:RecG-like helicase
MKTKLTPIVAVIALMMALNPTAFAKGKEVTITGEGQCAMCALHESKSCENTITVEEHGKKVTYYLTQNEVSKGFHHNICKSPAKVTATGEVKEAHGKMEMTPTKIELAK